MKFMYVDTLASAWPCVADRHVQCRYKDVWRWKNPPQVFYETHNTKGGTVAGSYVTATETNVCDAEHLYCEHMCCEHF